MITATSGAEVPARFASTVRVCPDTAYAATHPSTQKAAAAPAATTWLMRWLLAKKCAKS
ncbi:MAG TPA: hypothetical protein VG164_00565 [Trebonia sp.]|nr:hypothetical protein [Trebonia sp.]